MSLDINAAAEAIARLPENQQAEAWRKLLRGESFDPKARRDFQKDWEESQETTGGPGA